MMKHLIVFLFIAAGVTIAYAAGVPQDSAPEPTAPAAVPIPSAVESAVLLASMQEEEGDEELDALIRKTYALLPELVRRAEELKAEGREKEARRLKERADELGRALALFERTRKDRRAPIPRRNRVLTRPQPKAERPTMVVTNDGEIVAYPGTETEVLVVKPGELEKLEGIAEVVELEDVYEVEPLVLEEIVIPEEVEEIEVIKEGEDLYAKAGARTRALRAVRDERARAAQRSRSRARARTEGEESVIVAGGGSGRTMAIGPVSVRGARAESGPAPRAVREEPKRRVMVTPHIEHEVVVPLKVDSEEMALNQKLRHLNMALENLHAAGLHEQAEHIAPHVSALEETIQAHRTAHRDAPHAEAPHPAPDAALAEKIEGLHAEVKGLRSDVQALREMVRALSKQVNAQKRAY